MCVEPNSETSRRATNLICYAAIVTAWGNADLEHLYGRFHTDRCKNQKARGAGAVFGAQFGHWKRLQDPDPCSQEPSGQRPARERVHFDPSQRSFLFSENKLELSGEVLRISELIEVQSIPGLDSARH
jgi:hypothetical protein